jgi:NAD(P)-dependent dehydrogenase (short-subunit alcohol dehydrogenase family)
MMMVDSKGVALVTGGNCGIGHAICLALAEAGYDIAVFDVAALPVDLPEKIQSMKRRILFRAVDVSSESEVTTGYKQIVLSLGQPVVLVNNAGIYPRSSALDMSYDLWKHVLDVNLGGTFLCSRAVAPAMLKRGEGAIVNIASGRALQGARKGSHYASSKAGIISLTKSLALEWAPHIRVNAVIPGVTDTAQPRQGGVSDEEIYARGTNIPLGRIGQPQDTAWAVEYLVSPRAAYITGQNLCVNGGSIMH